MAEHINLKNLVGWLQPRLSDTLVPLIAPTSKREKYGIGDLTLPGVGRGVQFGTDVFGNPILVLSPDTPAGALPTTQISFNAYIGIDNLEQFKDINKRFYWQRRYYDCGIADDPDNWNVIESFDQSSITQEGRVAGPTLEFTDGLQVVTSDVALETYSKILRATLANITITSPVDDNFVSIWSVQDILDCAAGFAGIDKVLFFGTAIASPAGPGEIYYTSNAGSTVQAIATDPSPFAVNSDISAGVSFPVNTFQMRILAGSGAEAATVASFAYADVVYPDEGDTITVAAWTGVTIADTAVDTSIDAIVKSGPNIFIATFVAGASDIYVSNDKGATDPGTPVYSNTLQISQLHVSPTGEVWAAGASNLLERGNCDGFTAVTGPEAATNHSVAIAKNGTVWVGNDTSIWRSKSLDGGTWEEMRDFGASHAVVHIHIVRGVSEQLIAVVDDSTPAQGEVWISVDGGNNWEQFTEIASPNDGYNAAFFSKNGLFDGNLGWVVGDADTDSVLHKLSPPATSVC